MKGARRGRKDKRAKGHFIDDGHEEIEEIEEMEEMEEGVKSAAPDLAFYGLSLLTKPPGSIGRDPSVTNYSLARSYKFEKMARLLSVLNAAAPPQNGHRTI